MRFAFLPGVLTLLLLVACVDEQWATPIGNETVTNTSAAPAAAAPAAQPALPAPPAPPAPATQPAPPAPPAPQGSQTTVNASAANTTLNTTLTCTETDTLDDKFIKGTTTYVIPGKVYVKTDECIANTLREWWCNKGELDVKLFECRGGCAEGACNKN